MKTITNNAEIEKAQFEQVSIEYHNEYSGALRNKLLLYGSAFLFVMSVLFSLNAFSQTAQNNQLRVVVLNENSGTVLNFSAKYNTGKVYIQWIAQNETKDGFYVIERSNNNKDFKTIGVKEGIGTSLSVALSYGWIDQKALQGAFYYRLKQISMDGAVVAVSPVVFVPGASQEASMNKSEAMHILNGSRPEDWNVARTRAGRLPQLDHSLSSRQIHLVTRATSDELHLLVGLALVSLKM